MIYMNIMYLCYGSDCIIISMEVINMLKKNFLTVLMFQLKLRIKSDSKHDYLVADDTYFSQLNKCIDTMYALNPDIVIFPEMSYHEKYHENLKNFSKNGNLIVFGSTYIGSINYTTIFHNGEFKRIQKRYACGSEPMVRFIDKIDVNTFLNQYLAEHEVHVKGNKLYILNCLEYYESAYLIARNPNLYENLFGFIVPCSNNNPDVFIAESNAIHNHNEHIYSFVCNHVEEDISKGYGKSYIYGPIQQHEKFWLEVEGVPSCKHNSSIVTMDNSTIGYVYAKYTAGNSLSRFGRSDCYANTPQNFVFKNLV